MIKIFYSTANLFPEINLSGNREDFTELNRKLRKFLESEAREIRIEAGTKFNPVPYEKMLESLIVLKSDNQVLVSVDSENELKVKGSPDCLDTFVSNIDFVEDDYHIHYEYYDGNEWILPESIPLLITSKK